MPAAGCGSTSMSTRRVFSSSPPPPSPSIDHHDGRADADALIEVGDILVEHADAAIGGGGADGGAHLVACAVDGDLVAVEGQCRDAHGIARRAALDQVRQFRVVALD